MRSTLPAASLGALIWSLSASAVAGTLTTEADGVQIEVRSEPETPVRDRKTTYIVRLADAAGKPVTDARVTLTGRMADGMSAAAPLRPSSEPGIYRGEVLFTMEGRWDLTVRVVSQGRRLELPLHEEVGR
ncbi:MAG: FixH family protein [Candidatus Rokubacteria bacterium]|nr:FixH family protein [Candidatus Rokubacteria bacterium]